MPLVRTGKEYRLQEARAKALFERQRIDRQTLSAQAMLEDDTRASLASDALPEASPYQQARAASARKRLDRAEGLKEHNQDKLDKTAPNSDLELSPEAQEAWSKPVSYFIGRKVVTQEEVDALVAAHYRKAEAAINMVFPLIAVYLAIAVTTANPLAHVVLGVVVAVVVVLLVVSGQRLNFQFKRKLRELITGRLEKAKAEENQEIKTIHDALMLAQKLLADAKKAKDAAGSSAAPEGAP